MRMDFRERSPTGFVHNSRNSHSVGADLSGNFMQDEHAQRIIQIVLEWAKALPTICAVALVGSHARGTARADSDIDLIVLTTDPQRFRADTVWLRAIDWNVIAARPAEWQDEDYGVLWSRLEPNRDEVEIGFALPSWQK
jgi:predicted nucleotidyltransferase